MSLEAPPSAGRRGRPSAKAEREVFGAGPHELVAQVNAIVGPARFRDHGDRRAEDCCGKIREAAAHHAAGNYYNVPGRQHSIRVPCRRLVIFGAVGALA